MFKRLMYDKVIEVLNLTTQTITSGGVSQPLKFKGGYLLGVLPSGIPYTIEQADPTTKFSYTNYEFIPVSEELSQETPSTNKSDRSDYVFRYSIMFRQDFETEIESALDEFRDYFYENKQFTLDGYTVAVKTTRGDKNPQVGREGGWYWCYYQFTIYATAIKNGYIAKDTDKWEMQLESTFGDSALANALTVGVAYEIVTLGTTDWNVVFGTTDETYIIGDSGVCVSNGTGTGTAKITYQELTLTNDVFSTQGNPIFSNATGTGKGHITHGTPTNQLTIVYTGTSLEKSIYNRIMNKLSKDTEFVLRHRFDDFSEGTFTYTGVIVGATRTIKPNSVVLMQIDWVESDG